MPASPIEDLLHRLNNLLGTIQLQGDVARTLGTHAACQEALRLIAESAARTQQELQRFRRTGGGLTGRGAGPAASAESD